MWLSTIQLDLRYAGRTLRRGKAFTALAIIILALGMGASVAIFSVLDSVVFKSLAVRDPARLVLFTRPQLQRSEHRHR